MENKDYINAIPNAERRFISHPVQYRVEKRDDDDDENHIIEGYAFKYGVRADFGWFEEEIARGAADEVMRRDDLDVRALFNHDRNLILARYCNEVKTLEMELDQVGLKYRFKTPNRSYAKDLQDAIMAGDITQSSFAFSVGPDGTRWSQLTDEKELRTITKFENLFDVSPVTFPAYKDTTVAKRERGEIKKEKNSLDHFRAKSIINSNYLSL
jgi:HK97 family phage prohead protease